MHEERTRRDDPPAMPGPVPYQGWREELATIRVLVIGVAAMALIIGAGLLGLYLVAQVLDVLVSMLAIVGAVAIVAWVVNQHPAPTARPRRVGADHEEVPHGTEHD